ncbi:MAG TPA: 2-oxoglutarate dehydrogenase, E2 component, dihydrolipoamide succinyltransferase [Pyrinomonadaceae bacterium]|nr:2-oxoglutarate dehydrogenase, E2 component, dihydrolipoamide succinyltransferase [Chloracidobacterium sp.]MBP9936768.1 2-oxoglutarate dehydrogenase, E2 component, dihydrolipoamide succinyltransferase [Pyrinomonadaceae bacterium]MBK9437990.1 2-oxoglutarate dehydrogenase, E2 component, dihydrolipoamide succinyltransferase [Chloracidobacterium sp.]MBK9765577.1 2-oxoglutarate dehydrogenase, E2 component, dihydrolipoamide succinyltransferase [Chloracidobacterium sp.]MBL0242171.1 2-oxoglutarate de
MSLEVVMPQMGESITEGTVSKWLKQVGDKIEKDEPVLEISTDKVDAEVPSPGAGTLLEIRHQEGETVEVGTVVAVIGAEGEASAIVTPPPAEAKAEPIAIVKTEPEVTPAPVVAEIQPPIATATGAASEVVMPQMGESITEGTVSKWLKAVGDVIEKDEPLLEISTDKVDAEVPSPAAGVLLSINVDEGQTVEVGSVLALVGAAGGAPSAKPAAVAPASIQPPAVEVQAPAAQVIPVMAKAAAASGNASLDELRQIKSSPLVRNIAREHGIDITRIAGSGISGRVTKGDIMAFIESGAALSPQDLMVKESVPKVSATVSTAPASTYSAPTIHATVDDRIEKMSVMRKKIAEHMTFSKQTSAHVTSVYEIDMTNVAKFRAAHQADFQAKFGTKLTFMPFIFQAVTAAIREFRIVNSQVDGDQIIYKGDINLGMAVALDWGLIVPVIKQADTLSLSQLAIAANDLADRARTKKLNPAEVQGGTFTITNPGVFGGLYGTPIINQPQVAILCVGTIEKRAKVLTSADGDDYIAIRQMAYFALTYDHRIVDGSDGERFLAFLKNFLETNNFAY